MVNLIDIEQQLIDENIGNPGQLLDIGCANGDNIIYYTKKGHSVTGLDLSDEMLQSSRNRIKQEGLETQLVKGNICDMNMLENNRFDYVICMFTLMNLKEEQLQRTAMNEMKRITKDSGKIFIMTHNSDKGKVINGDWFGKKYDYRIYSTDEIKQLIENTNLYIHRIDIIHNNEYIFAVCSKNPPEA